jgi:hypothetical protein
VAEKRDKTLFLKFVYLALIHIGKLHPLGSNN